MATEFTVKLADQPGTLAKMGRALGKAGVNIDAIQGMPCEDKAVIQFVPNNADRTSQALDEIEMPYTTREVIIVNILDEPGTLGDVALVMADAGINIDAVYATHKGLVVLGVDDVQGAKQVAGGMAVM